MEINKIKGFGKRLNYIGDLIKAESNVVDNIKEESKRYEIVEKFIQMLIEASEKEENNKTVEEVDEFNYLDYHFLGERIADYCREGKKVMAIKELRETLKRDLGDAYNIGLKEAKEEIERVWDVVKNDWAVSEWIYKDVRLK